MLSLPSGRTAALFVDLQEEHRGDPRYLVEVFDRVLADAARLQAAARNAGALLFRRAYIVDLAQHRRPPPSP